MRVRYSLFSMNKDEINKIAEYIFLPSDSQPADLALVFGASTMKPPVDTAVELHQKGLVPKILVSGGVNRHTGQNEAQSMAALLVDRGVPLEDVLTEDKSHNSLENVLFSRVVIESDLGWDAVKKILVVCANYHSRRALMTLKRHFPDGVALALVTYQIPGFNRDNWHESEVGQKKVLDEWGKIPKYLAKGDIEEL